MVTYLQGGGGYFTKFLVRDPAQDERMDAIRSGIVKMRGQRDLRTMKKGINHIKNQGENLYKMLQNGPMKENKRLFDRYFTCSDVIIILV